MLKTVVAAAVMSAAVAACAAKVNGTAPLDASPSTTPDAAAEVRPDVMPADLPSFDLWPACDPATGLNCPVPPCGNGKLDLPVETCDDGNTKGGDGCSPVCKTETDWICTSPGRPCRGTVFCGDGLVGGSEMCDDRNQTSGDGCSEDCRIEPGWICPAMGARCIPICNPASSSSDAEIARRLEAAVEDVDQAIRDLRNYIFGLRPGILADRQLDQAFKELATEFGARSGVVTVVDVDGEAASALASRAGEVIQLAREALSNVSRHSDATTCRVSLRRGAAGIFLEIDDDGRGFDVDTTTQGMGLRNLRDRAESLGGKLEIRSTPAEGTTVRATIPS